MKKDAVNDTWSALVCEIYSVLNTFKMIDYRCL